MEPVLLPDGWTGRSSSEHGEYVNQSSHQSGYVQDRNSLMRPSLPLQQSGDESPDFDRASLHRSREDEEWDLFELSP
jgi:hypothetical protein